MSTIFVFWQSFKRCTGSDSWNYSGLLSPSNTVFYFIVFEGKTSRHILCSLNAILRRNRGNGIIGNITSFTRLSIVTASGGPQWYPPFNSSQLARQSIRYSKPLDMYGIASLQITCSSRRKKRVPIGLRRDLGRRLTLLRGLLCFYGSLLTHRGKNDNV